MQLIRVMAHRLHAHAHTHTHTHTHRYRYTEIREENFMQISSSQTYIHRNTHIRTYKHTHIHTHTYTCRLKPRRSGRPLRRSG